MMLIRKAEERDLTQLLELYDSLYDILIHNYGFPFDFSREENEAVLRVQLKSRLCCIFVAEEGETLLGFVHGSVVKLDRRLSYQGQSAIARIDDVYVRPETRGGGLARTLMDAAEDWFRSEELPVAESYILDGNQQSLRFHEKRGYETIAKRTVKRL
jgi:ribosomal protein S18 acetylase RimI-like enzyme